MKLTPSRPPTIASTSVTTRARSGTKNPCLSPWRAAILPAAYPPMRKAKSNVISSPIRAVVPPSVKPWRPAEPKIAPTILLTIPLKMRPAPRAASHPRTTLTQLVPLSSSSGVYLELRPSRTSCSSTFGVSVFPSLLPLVLIFYLLLLVECRQCTVASLAGTLGLGHGAVVKQRSQHSSYDRPKDVEPETCKIPGNQHRSEGARRVDRPACYGS